MPSQQRTEERLTIREIAETAGVSAMTVSRVLNKRPDVAPATRERIEQIVAESGFVRSRAARAMRKGRHGLIDLVVLSLDSPYILEIIRGVEEALEPTGLRLVVSATHGEDQRERQWLAKIADGWTDGAILVLAQGQSERVQSLRRRRTPFVVVDHEGELGPHVPSVGATNWAGARSATEYLLSLGHRRIAFIGGSPTLGCAQERASGYREAMQSAGVEPDPQLIRPGTFRHESGYEQTMALLDMASPPTAIFAGNDTMAFGCYSALRARGVRVPDAMSVVGFDDVLVAPLVIPPLTTVRQPLVDMGRFAVSMLLRQIEGMPLDALRVELATSLVVRESCARPAARSRRQAPS
ncbi:MAG: LacI family DNA-binding transcriptional regulator [Acidimicrobiales bacterium]|jgi:LacI family transcriptional regulator